MILPRNIFLSDRFLTLVSGIYIMTFTHTPQEEVLPQDNILSVTCVWSQH